MKPEPVAPAPASLYDRLRSLLRRRGALHAALIDPDPLRQPPAAAAALAATADRCGSDLFLLGGSTCFDPATIARTLAAIRERTAKPVILFPGAVQSVPPHADGILFLSVLNAGNAHFFSGQQALGALAVRQAGLEAIGTAYLIVAPGGTAGWVAQANPLPRDKPGLAAAYALAAQYMGFRLLYLEAGSGAAGSVPAELIAAVRAVVQIPVIVGGGIDTPESAATAVEAGADLVVQGTFIEQTLPRDGGAALTEVIQAIHTAGRRRCSD